MKRSREPQRTQETRPGMEQREESPSLLPPLLVLMRLVLAFACGWFLAFLFARIDQGGNFFLFLVSPLFLGIVAPWTVGRRNKHPILLSFATGSLVAAGISTYWFPLAWQADAASEAYCLAHECHGGGSYVLLVLLFFLFGSVVALLGAGISRLLQSDWE